MNEQDSHPGSKKGQHLNILTYTKFTHHPTISTNLSRTTDEDRMGESDGGKVWVSPPAVVVLTLKDTRGLSFSGRWSVMGGKSRNGQGSQNRSDGSRWYVPSRDLLKTKNRYEIYKTSSFCSLHRVYSPNLNYRSILETPKIVKVKFSFVLCTLIWMFLHKHRPRFRKTVKPHSKISFFSGGVEWP